MSPLERVQLYEDTLLAIAAEVATAREATPPGSMRLRDGVGEELLVQLEYHLTQLITLGAVPRPRAEQERERVVAIRGEVVRESPRELEL